MNNSHIPFSSGIGPPKLKAPEYVCDCHHHIYDKGVAPAAGETVLIDATVEDYQRLQKRLGVTRNVVVTPSNYGTNNEVTLAALAHFGDSARGIAVVDENVTDAELKRLDRKGVRGIRFREPPSPQVLVTLSKRITGLSWHIQFNVRNKDFLVAAETLLGDLPSPIVFDHFARIGSADDPAINIVKRMLDRGKIWIKLAAIYSMSRVGAPSYADTVAVGQAFVQAAPERMIWGSDWPHPRASVMPDDAALFDLNLIWAPDDATRELILVRNPEALYGFARAPMDRNNFTDRV